MKDYTEFAQVELGQNANLLECINDLLKQLKGNSVGNNANKVGRWKDCLRGKKDMNKPVLLLLDNVWGQKDLEVLLQMELLAPRSIIIITTRLERILDQFSKFVQKREIRGLDDNAAKRLLRSKAGIYDEDLVTNDLLDSEEKIVKGCFGVPLLLEVVGGVSLKNKSDKKTWEVRSLISCSLSRIVLLLGMCSYTTCCMLQEACSRLNCNKLNKFEDDDRNKDVQEILSLQLKNVEDVCLDMFYDVATVFHGRPVEHCLRAWDSVYADELGPAGNINIEWKNLLAKSLVKIVWDYDLFGNGKCEVVHIHDALRHLGRVKCNSKENVGKRVWVEDGKLQGLKRSNRVSLTNLLIEPLLLQYSIVKNYVKLDSHHKFILLSRSQCMVKSSWPHLMGAIENCSARI